ncbi:MAG: OmpA family protein, partial [Bacteroidota bacterium]
KQPSISADGSTLYFASDRPGGKGGLDIWMSKVDELGLWSSPINLGDSINSPGNEQSPFIHFDGQTLYFSSDGLVGFGGHDLYYTKKNLLGEWKKPINLGYPINTYDDEIGLMIDAEGKTGYFSSTNVINGKKQDNLDIYRFKLPQDIRPTPVSYMKGRVKDAEFKTSISARFELIDLMTGKTIHESYSDHKNGEFLVCIPANRNYALNVSKTGYLFYSENFSFEGIHSIEEPFLKDIELKKIKLGEIIVLRNVFFEHDSYVLKPESKSELNQLINFLNSNTRLKVKIGGHTDYHGTGEYNLTLSQNRAKAVKDYLVENGIEITRLTYKGYGETKPIATNDTPGGRALNRRTECKIIGID